MIPAAPTPDGADDPRRPAFPLRLAAHAIGWTLAGIVAWLILQAYRDPALMLELANWRLC